MVQVDELNSNRNEGATGPEIACLGYNPNAWWAG